MPLHIECLYGFRLFVQKIHLQLINILLLHVNNISC